MSAFGGKADIRQSFDYSPKIKLSPSDLARATLAGCRSVTVLLFEKFRYRGFFFRYFDWPYELASCIKMPDFSSKNMPVGWRYVSPRVSLSSRLVDC
jgi:hypothetical protein